MSIKKSLVCLGKYGGIAAILDLKDPKFPDFQKTGPPPKKKKCPKIFQFAFLQHGGHLG
jgi:hypothetical protein